HVDATRLGELTESMTDSDVPSSIRRRSHRVSQDVTVERVRRSWLIGESVTLESQVHAVRIATVVVDISDRKRHMDLLIPTWHRVAYMRAPIEPPEAT